MTGYGRAEGKVGGRSATIELRSVNHRFADVRLSVPRDWMALEVGLEKGIRKRIGRGRIECSIRAQGGAAELGVPELNLQFLDRYLAVVAEIAKRAGIDNRPTLATLANAEGVIEFKTAPMDVDSLQADADTLLVEALDALDGMRSHEGERMAAVIQSHLDKAEELLGSIRKTMPDEQRQISLRMTERIQNMADQVRVCDERLAQELAVLAERYDVTEELSRLDIHVGQFKQLCMKDGPIGRELDFLLQEMNREINTVCSKFHSAPIVRKAVAVKAEVEKIREQVQNVE